MSSVELTTLIKRFSQNFRRKNKGMWKELRTNLYLLRQKKLSEQYHRRKSNI